MSRGETGVRTGRSRGVAIGVSFALVCLGALTLVLKTTGAIEHFRAPWAYTPPDEPVVGVYSALSSVTGVCTTAAPGPVMPGPATRRDPGSNLGAWLSEQGLVELPEAAHTLDLPATVDSTRLAGACGFALLSVEPGGSLTAWASSYGRTDRAASAYALCGIDTVSVAGTGSARARYFVLPGLTADAVETTGLSAPTLMRMAAAEASLARRGFVPGQRYRVEPIAAGPAGGTHRLTPPATPASGCVAWVAIGESLSNANSSFEGQPIANSCPDGDLGQEGFSVALVSCAATGTTTGAGEISFTDTDGDGGRVVFRPFGIGTSGPQLHHSAPATTVGSLRETQGATITLPTPVARLEP